MGGPPSFELRRSPWSCPISHEGYLQVVLVTVLFNLLIFWWLLSTGSALLSSLRLRRYLASRRFAVVSSGAGPASRGDWLFPCCLSWHPCFFAEHFLLALDGHGGFLEDRSQNPEGHFQKPVGHFSLLVVMPSHSRLD